MLITLAQLVTKALGAVHRPVAQSLIGDAGLKLATPPSHAYYIMLAISSVGLNVAISRLVSERLAVGDQRGARRVFSVAVKMLVVSGTVFSLVFAAGARWLADYFYMPEAWLGFLVLAPALFFVALLCIFRGLYQGMQQMAPSATSQVVEQFARVGISLALIALLAANVSWGAAAFNAGNTIGIFAAVVYFAWIYMRERPTEGWNDVTPGVESWEHASTRMLLGKILSIALPLALMGAVLPIMGIVDSKVVTHQLLAQGLPQDMASVAQAWLANAGTLRDLPTILTTALYISLVPAVAESFARGNLDQARFRTATSFRITFLVGIPATVALLAAGPDIYGVLYTGSGAWVMTTLAASCIFMMMQQTASGALQGMGKIWVSVRNMLIGVVVKLGLTYWWTGLPALLEHGAALATVAGFLVASLLQLVALKRVLGFTVDLRGHVWRPLVASAPMAVVLVLVSPLVHAVVTHQRLAGLIIVALGGLVYLVAILLAGGITMTDIGLIPGFPQRAADWLVRRRLLRVESEEVRQP